MSAPTPDVIWMRTEPGVIVNLATGERVTRDDDPEEYADLLALICETRRDLLGPDA